MEFSVQYGQDPELTYPEHYRGRVTVSEKGISITARRPLLHQAYALTSLGIVCFLFFMLPLGCILYQGLASPGELPSLSLQFMVVETLITVMGFFLLVCPLSRVTRVISHDRIQQINQVWRQLTILTNDQRRYVLHTLTLADADTLAASLSAPTAAPITRTIRFGRDTLADSSGFDTGPMQLTLIDESLILTAKLIPSVGRALASLGAILIGIIATLAVATLLPQGWWSIPLVFLTIIIMFTLFGIFASSGPVVTRSLARASLSGITIDGRIVAFYGVDVQVGECRYVLEAPSEEKAHALANTMQTHDYEFSSTDFSIVRDYPSIIRYAASASRYLPRTVRILVSDTSIILENCPSLPNPQANRLKYITVITIYFLLVLASSLFFPDAHRIFIWMTPAVFILMVVYVPLSLLLHACIRPKITLPRDKVHLAIQCEREIALLIQYGRHIRHTCLFHAGTTSTASVLALAINTPANGTHIDVAT